MYTYNLFEWLLFFYIYCFLGWIIESTIVSISQKRLVNRGFVKGPVLPIYGSGAIMMLLVGIPFKGHIVLVYILGVICATILEYITGWLMETILHMKYWDYSNDKFNYKGRICLESSLFWGVLTVVLTYIVHAPIENFVLKLVNKEFLAIFITIIFVVDFTHSFYKVTKFNTHLQVISKFRSELDELYAKIKKTGDAEATLLNNRIKDLTADYNKYINNVRFFYKDLISSYPKMNSKNFNESLKTIKSILHEKISKH